MSDTEAKPRAYSGLYAHLEPIHRILDYQSELTADDCALLDRLSKEVRVSRREWTELRRLWERVREGRDKNKLLK